MGCSLKKEKQFSTININEQNTCYFVIINRDQELQKFKKACRFSNSIPILGSINYSTIISRRNKLFQSQIDRKPLEMNNIDTSSSEQHKK
ncbi:unnamed protein product [Paramecium primaurelia]|uniref:Uncharacterized protein n=1 Tax=Paramecium primaurelia TaxID=5886 RepID=A0A8S1KFC5_PARPR|nr:unnamed protein product [Paramecium primaurelia]